MEPSGAVYGEDKRIWLPFAPLANNAASRYPLATPPAERLSLLRLLKGRFVRIPAFKQLLKFLYFQGKFFSFFSYLGGARLFGGQLRHLEVPLAHLNTPPLRWLFSKATQQNKEQKLCFAV
jgi:hypothetical protein